MNLPNLVAVIRGGDAPPPKSNYNFLLKADKGLTMSIGKTRAANSVMGLSSPSNLKQHGSEFNIRPIQVE